MNLRVAMALSGNNKAKGRNDEGHLIIVQKRYQGRLQWLHTWLVKGAQVIIEEDWENDFLLKEVFKIDPDTEYWEPI